MSAPPSPTHTQSVSASLSNGTTGEGKNADIWSTRLQRELLALTTDNVTEEAKKEMTDVLPPFCSVKEHSLDIEKGNCTVTCLLDLELPKAAAKEESETATESLEANTADPITITFDVSLKKKADGSVDGSAVSYPFLKPLAIVTSGSSSFPTGSTVKNGDCIDIEMDWTPSLHLSDAVLNVALKIKECLSQGEAVYAMDPGQASKGDVVNDAVNKAKTLGSSFSASIRNLTKPGEKGDKKKSRFPGLGRKKRAPRPKATATEVRIGDEINMLEAPWVDCQGVYSCKAIRRPKFAEEAIKAAEVKEKKKQESEAGEQVGATSASASVSSLLDEASDQGPVPEAFGDYMRLQAGSVSQVCRVSTTVFVQCHYSRIA
jgi:hypothetical protein